MIQLLVLLAGVYITLKISAALFGTARYDIAEARHERAYRQAPHSKIYRRRPTVTVLVHVRDQANALAATLESLRAVNYKKLQIVIADAASTDDSRSVARTFIKNNPKRSTKLFAQRTNRSVADSVSAATKHISGELVVVLRAGDVLQKQSLQEVVRRHNLLPDMAIRLNQIVVPQPSIRNLVGRHASVYLQGHLKAQAMLGGLIETRIQSGICYGIDHLQQLNLGTKHVALTYLSSAQYVQFEYLRYAVRKQPLPHRMIAVGSNMFTAVGLAATAVLAYYSTYLAVVLHQPTLLAALLIVGVAYTMHMVWSAEALSVLAKIRYTFTIPAMLLPAVVGMFYQLFISMWQIASGYRSRVTQLL